MFDLDLAAEYAIEQGFEVNRREDHILAVNLGTDPILCFENLPNDNDTIIYFDDHDSCWHSHGDLFIEKGDDVSLVPIDILESLQNGSFLISIFSYADGKQETSLEHSWREFDLNTLGEGERQTYIRIPRIGASESKSEEKTDG